MTKNEKTSILPASRFNGLEISLIRQINALATPLTLNLGLGEPNIEPDETFREMARRAASEGSWRYTANAGALSLRRKIAESTEGRYDPASEICVSAGTQEGLYAVFQAFLEEGDEILLPDPGFLSYQVLATLAGATPVSYTLHPPNWKLDLEELTGRINRRTKAIVVNSPSNPTGSTLDARTVHELSSLAADRGILVISDEVYRELYYEQRPASFQGLGPGVVVVGGMSKSHAMTGLRLGWILAEDPLMATIVKAHQYIATCASGFSQELARLVFENRDWNRAWLDRVRARFSEQRSAALSAIERHLDAPIPPPAGAFYAFVPVPVCDSLTLARSLATDAAVLTIPGVAFGPGGEGFLRISFAAAPETVSAGIERIGRYLAESMDSGKSS